MSGRKHVTATVLHKGFLAVTRVTLLADRGAWCVQAPIYTKKPHCGAMIVVVTGWWEECEGLAQVAWAL